VYEGEGFYHVEQLRHLLGNTLTLPLTVRGHLCEGTRVSRRTIERAEQKDCLRGVPPTPGRHVTPN